MENNKENLLQKIESAQLVLVGIGTEFQGNKQEFMQSQIYSKYESKAKDVNEDISWMLPILYKKWNNEYQSEERIAGYEALAKLLFEKNYFIVTMCSDGMIHETCLSKERIVAPCGNFHLWQCSQLCTKDLQETFYFDELENKVFSFFEDANNKIEMPKRPICDICGNAMNYNIVSNEKYNENGYLLMWEKYSKWLQGTLNKELCVLELGVDLKFPSIIRWPFEKIVFLNQKACFFRVHKSLYQLTEELNGKGCSIPDNSVDYMRKLFV